MAPHIVFVGDELPFAQVAGHLRVNMALLQFLRARGYRVSILLTAARLPGPVAVNAYPDITVAGPEIKSFGRYIVPKGPAALVKLLGKRVVEAGPPLLQNLVQWLRTGRSPTAKGIVGVYPTERQIEGAVRWIDTARPDVLLIDTMFRCPIIPRLATPRPKTVVVTHDVHHRRHASLVKQGIAIEPATLTREQEISLLCRADVIVAITPEEKAILADMLPGSAVIDAGMPVSPVPRPAAQPRDPKLALFVGSAGIHNLDGLRWFLGEVWPLVRAGLSDARLSVCGLVGRAVPFPPPGVTLHGQVADLTPHYHAAGHAICPLRAGSGLKIKMLEYFAHGLPCVTTAVGAGGFAESAAPPYVVADAPRAFADAMLAFMTDAERIAAFEARAYDYCELYSEARMFGTLLEYLPPLAT